MLTNTIKTILTLTAVTLFLAACSNSSTKSSSTDASANAEPVVNEVVDTTPVAPSQTVFYFDFDSAALRYDSRELLNAHAAALKATPRAIRLEGHADERGTREYNIALGERRAQVVRAYLVQQGVTSPIEVVSYGEERPAVAESNEYAWQRNRRVEIK